MSISHAAEQETEPTTDRDDDSRPLPGDSDVGYGRPPKHSRFKPGQSGNPQGRRPGARGRDQIVEAIAEEMHTVIENGVQQRRSTLELVLLSLRNRAFTGNVKAFRAVDKLLERYGPQEAQHSGGFLIVGERPMDFEEFEREVGEQQAPYRGDAKLHDMP